MLECHWREKLAGEGNKSPGTDRDDEGVVIGGAGRQNMGRCVRRYVTWKKGV